MDKKIFVEDGVGFVELMDVFGSDLTIVNAARVSFNKESEFEAVVNPQSGDIEGYRLSERDKKLVCFLAEHNHVTPFFHPILRFRLKMPIFVAREWFRSTVGFARNEVSRRYVTYEPEFYVPAAYRKRDKDLRQGSKSEAVDRNDAVRERVAKFYKESVEFYNDLMAMEEVCPEQARGVLPQAMYTEFIETASLAAYARIVQLRTDPGAQREIQRYANMVSELLAPHFPVSWAALRKMKIEDELVLAEQVKQVTVNF
jgi:thymidylate synthase (FAD)